MTIREFVGVIDAGITVDVEKSGATVAMFDVAYVDSIIDEILDTEIGHITIGAVKGVTTVTITEEEADGGDDGDDGGNTEPDDEP